MRTFNAANPAAVCVSVTRSPTWTPAMDGRLTRQVPVITGRAACRPRLAAIRLGEGNGE